VNKFFDDLNHRFVVAAERTGAMIESPSLDTQIALELLELARVVAHMSERRFAPLSCFLAGVAAERMRVTCGSGEDEVAPYVLPSKEPL
jgi:hypothetical protein